MNPLPKPSPPSSPLKVHRRKQCLLALLHPDHFREGHYCRGLNNYLYYVGWGGGGGGGEVLIIVLVNYSINYPKTIVEKAV